MTLMHFQEIFGNLFSIRLIDDGILTDFLEQLTKVSKEAQHHVSFQIYIPILKKDNNSVSKFIMKSPFILPYNLLAPPYSFTLPFNLRLRSYRLFLSWLFSSSSFP